MTETPLSDFGAAANAVTNPATPPADLAAIAQLHPQLRAQVAVHPSTYDGLLDWLTTHGDDQVKALVQSRRTQAYGPPPAQPPPAQPPPAQPPPAQPPPVQPTMVLPSTPSPAAWSQSTPPTGGAFPGPGYPPAAGSYPGPGYPPAAGAYPGPGYPPAAGSLPGPGYPPAAKPSVAAKLKKPKVIISAVAILVVVALVIAGISTSAFGLIGGGARSAESEAKQVVKKVEALVNSFNAKSVLSNPLASFGDLSKELAPSETRLGASGGSLDLVEALGISSETLGWLTDLAGAFTVKTKDIAVNTFSITDDIALARLTGGTLTIEVNSAALRTALNKTSGIIDQQLVATAKAYGFDLNLYAFGSTSLGESLLYDMLYMPKNWVDQLVSEVEASFPLTIDFAAEWRDWQDCLKSKYQGSYNRCGGDYSDISSFILVKEQGKWYLSWMLTSNFTSFDLDVNASIKDWVQANWDDLEIGWDSTFDEWQKQNCAISDELASKLNVVPATNKSPLEAANAMVRALQSGDQRAVLAQLPLAERRYAAMSGTLNDFEATIAGNSGGNPTFSLINQKGDWATLKIVDLRVTEPGRYGADIGISDGTCYHTYPGSDIYCLTEELNKIDTDQLNELFDPNNKVWSDLGIDPQVLTTKIKLAIRTATDAIDPEAIGVVAIKESNSWHISASATSSQLLNQLTTALFEGLKAARK